DTLKAMGAWMKQYGESVYGAKGNVIPPQEWGVVTVKDKTIYAHILKKPSDTYIFIPGIQQKVKTVIALTDKKNLKFKQQPEGLFVYTDGITWDDLDTIIQVQ